MYRINRILIDESNHEASVTCESSSFFVTTKDVESLSLIEGEEIDEDTYTQLCEADSRLSCIKKAFVYLAYGDLSAKKLTEKLQAKFEKSVVADVIELLQERKYLDDAALAVRYAKSFYEFKLWGPIRIKSDLYTRGFQKEDINEACASLEEYDHRDNIKNIIERKYGASPEKLTLQKQKICAYLYRMGYSYGDISDTINMMTDIDE